MNKGVSVLSFRLLNHMSETRVWQRRRSHRVRRSRESETTGTVEELLKYFSYTLECGKSYEWEKGNSKINLNPKSAKSLVTQLNKAEANSAANGYSENSYKLKTK